MAEEPDVTAIEVETVAPAQDIPPVAKPQPAEVAAAAPEAPKAVPPAAPRRPVPEIVASVQVPDDPGPEPDPEMDDSPPPRRWRLFG
jgi:hypothetical protein